MKIQRIPAGLLAAFAAYGMFGCQSIPTAKDAAKVGVSFNWPKNTPCFGHSPEISLSNLPKDTKYLSFNMRDFQSSYRHGGGVVEYIGKNVIPEGALKNYAGPCPPAGQTHTYEISVEVMNDRKDLIIGNGSFSRKFPE